jgi:D-alanyl-lipoteichoic acid acyltransferase DltB (MBOAT superfamily)
MIFNSLTYLLLLLVVVPLYWWLPRTPRQWLLLTCNLAFYGFWRFDYIPVMLASVTADYVAALAIHSTLSPRRRRLFLVLSLMFNFGLLGYFKYTIFAVENFNALSQWLVGHTALGVPNILLPLGISFYTFHSVSYTVDVYRCFIAPTRDYVLFANYVTFFPQLIAGPILRAREVMGQLDRRPAFAASDLIYGLQRIIGGLFLKVVLADNIAGFVDDGFLIPAASLSAWDSWALALLFGFQIYFDFSAYSHIAIGTARLMGIRFPENFNFPYSALSPRDFWRRWHISLGSWIRDYLYLPLCGARVRDDSLGGIAVAAEAETTARRRTIALIVTWTVMGLWHGAAWSFVLWGLYHAVLIAAYRLATAFGAPGRRVAAAGWLLTFPLIMAGWIPFRAASVGDALALWQHLLNWRDYLDPTFLGRGYFLAALPRNLAPNYYLLAVALILAVLVAHALRNWLFRIRPPMSLWLPTEAMAYSVAYSVLLAGIFIYLQPVRQFIYFQF